MPAIVAASIVIQTGSRPISKRTDPMTSLLNALNSGKTSLLANQKSIEIVGNNIANVNTDGYSRQRAELTEIPAVAFGSFFIGQGVTVSNVQRDYSVFIAKQLQDKSVEYGEETGDERRQDRE